MKRESLCSYLNRLNWHFSVQTEHTKTQTYDFEQLRIHIQYLFYT